MATVARKVEGGYVIDGSKVFITQGSVGGTYVVNARTDVFWLGALVAGARMDETLRRAEAYARAGADGIFVPGLTERDDISRAVRAIALPLNVLAGPKTPPAADLAGLGVKRLSLGSGPMRATLGLLRQIAREVLDHGTYGFLKEAVPYDDANQL